MRSEVNEILELLKIAKSKTGVSGEEVDEKRQVTFGYMDNQIEVEIDQVHT